MVADLSAGRLANYIGAMLQAVTLNPFERPVIEGISLTVKAEERLDLLMRCRADLDNVLKRSVREKEENIKYASEKLVCKLLPVLDSLEQAAKHDQGSNVLYMQLLASLASEGLAPIEAKGMKFDQDTKRLTGTPTVVGTFQVVFNVTDADGVAPKDPLEQEISVQDEYTIELRYNEKEIEEALAELEDEFIPFDDRSLSVHIVDGYASTYTWTVKIDDEEIEAELEELEHVFALLVQGAFVGIPSPPMQISLSLLPLMEREILLMTEKIDTANEPLSHLFSTFDVS